jgi:hypothetical protein
MSQPPQAKEAAGKAFVEARRRGLDERLVHPTDLATYRVLEAAKEK